MLLKAQELENARTRYRCQRGMLELDLVLLPFYDDYYHYLNQEEKEMFRALLECTDPELWDWLIVNKEPTEKHDTIVQRIRATN